MLKTQENLFTPPEAKECGSCILFHLNVGCSIKLRNPKTYEQTINIVATQGFGSVCSFNRHKARVYDAYLSECSNRFALILNTV